MINIVVCLKQVPDPEAPTSVYKVDNEGRHIILTGVPPVISPFDENALEAAIRIKAAHEGKISVLTIGRNLSRAVLRKSLAVGADELILVEDNVLVDLDSYSTASILAAAIKKIGKYDLILAGREAADSNAGVVGSGIAEILGISSITIARAIEVHSDNKVRVQRIVPDGYEVVETSSPVLVTVSNEVGELRSATIQEMVAAQKKPITVWNTESLDIQLPKTAKSRLLSLFIPKKEMRCEFVEGKTGEEMGENLALKLKESGLI
jgi:electron transfer flavoprotein beta subunit